MRLLLLLIIFLFALVLRLYQLNNLPGEWYGDISNVHEYVRQVLKGEWPFYFFQSPGPLYHYLIAPFIAFYYQGYFSYKLASVGVSLLGLAGIYLLAGELFGKKRALIAVLVSGSSFWFLVWSRLGNSQVVIPVLTSFSLYLFLRFVHTGRFRFLFAGIITASLGWYTYPQTFLLAPLFMILAFAYWLIQKSVRKNLHTVFLLICIGVLLTIPFIKVVQKQYFEFTRGYLGEKIFAAKEQKSDFLPRLNSYFVKTLLMLHVRGDTTFRVNVVGRPHLDRVSGVFFLFGIMALVYQKKWRVLILILGSIFVLIIPSISPAIEASEIPSSSRTIGIVPFVYLLVALGIYESYRWLMTFFAGPAPVKLESFYGVTRSSYTAKVLTSLVFALLLFFQAYVNLRQYFVDYAYGLPDHNFAPGKKIAAYIDKEVPAGVAVYFGSCCWGQWGEPEPKGVYYNLLKKRIVEDPNKTLDGCREVLRFPALVVIAPTRLDTLADYKKCFPEAEVSDIVQDGKVLFKQILVKEKP